MITLHTVETILTLLIAYFFVATIGGSFSAYIAQKVYDFEADIPYPSLNPLHYIDFIGLLFLIFFGFGWGKYSRINPAFIGQPYRGLKLIIAWLAEPFINLLMAFISLVILLNTFGIEIIELVVPMVHHNVISLQLLAEYYPTVPSLTLAIGIILVTIVFLSILLATFSCITVGSRLLLFYFFEESALDEDFFAIALPLLFMFFFMYPLKLYFLMGIVKISQYIIGLL